MLNCPSLFECHLFISSFQYCFRFHIIVVGSLWLFFLVNALVQEARTMSYTVGKGLKDATPMKVFYFTAANFHIIHETH